MTNATTKIDTINAMLSFAEVRDDLSSTFMERDDEIDALYMEIFRELLEVMRHDPATVAQAIELILVARFAERIADQATNICEEVVYLVEARPIRHQPRTSTGGE